MSISASSCFSIVVASSIIISCFVVFWKFEITVANNANLLKDNYTTSEIGTLVCKNLKFKHLKPNQRSFISLKCGTAVALTGSINVKIDVEEAYRLQITPGSPQLGSS